MITVKSTSKGTDNGVVKLITLTPGLYHIKCAGAKGGAGNGNKSIQSCLGGFGATIEGVVSFKTEVELIVLPGNPGSDHPGTSGDGTSGGGGGGTYIALIVDSTHEGATLTSGFTNASFNGKYVVPLMVAAGGNGGRDYGYSGDGTTYHGVHTTHSTFISGSGQGGSFTNLTASNSSNGSNFINGGGAATYAYSRNGTSKAGYGGGGASQDDKEGGGGGGYYGGHRTLSACSYYNETYITDYKGTTGSNNGYGYVEILKIASGTNFENNGKFTLDISHIVKDNPVGGIIIEDVRLLPTNTTIKSYIYVNEVKSELETGTLIQCSANDKLKLEYELKGNGEITPVIRNIKIFIQPEIDDKKVILHLSEYTKFNNAIGKVYVEYYGGIGMLSGETGINIEDFKAEFEPINIVPKVNPMVTDTVNAVIANVTIGSTHIGTVHIRGNEDYVVASIGDITITGTRINNINP